MYFIKCEHFHESGSYISINFTQVITAALLLDARTHEEYLGLSLVDGGTVYVVATLELLRLTRLA